MEYEPGSRIFLGIRDVGNILGVPTRVTVSYLSAPTCGKLIGSERGDLLNESSSPPRFTSSDTPRPCLRQLERRQTANIQHRSSANLNPWHSDTLPHEYEQSTFNARRMRETY